MNKEREVRVTVYRVIRAKNSRDGGPAYTFQTNTGPFRTVPDTMQAYALENDFQVQSTLDMDVTLKLQGGQVFDWTIHEQPASTK